MSQENVDLHRRVYAAFNARDIDALLALVDPNAEWKSMMTVPGGATYRGHDGVRQWLADLEEVWGSDFRAELETVFDLGDQTLASVVLRGRGRQSGVNAAMSSAQVMKWRDRRCVYYRAYIDREDALRDLGVSEETLRDDLDPGRHHRLEQDAHADAETGGY